MAYLPNPGQYVHGVAGAKALDESHLLVTTDSGQKFRITVEGPLDEDAVSDLEDEAIVAGAHAKLTAELDAEDAVAQPV